MPFAKRVVEPQLLCRYQIPNEEGLLFEDLVSISNVALSRTLRQLSDLAKHACSIFQELENDLTSTNLRVRGLQSKISLLQQTCSDTSAPGGLPGLRFKWFLLNRSVKSSIPSSR
uniref:Nance-Horan syndrome protein n=1 Tax=Seriola dumerili TaxID=41447 RepID=A0A3B4VDF4_SERDU